MPLETILVKKNVLVTI